MAIPLSSPIVAEIEGAGVEVRDKRGVRRVGGTQLRQLSNDTICAIASKFDGDKVADLLEELTQANCVTNGGKVIADNRTRLAALTLTLAYLIGRPVERQEILTVNVDADAEAGLAERLKNSPALRQVFRRVLDEIETVPE